jgi:hypothetical protein
MDVPSKTVSVGSFIGRMLGFISIFEYSEIFTTFKKSRT